jgi:hypothetical protein
MKFQTLSFLIRISAAEQVKRMEKTVKAHTLYSEKLKEEPTDPRWSCGLRLKPAAARLLWILLTAWRFVCLFVACCVGSRVCDEVFSRSETLHQKCVCLSAFDLETSKHGTAYNRGGLTRHTRRKGRTLSGWSKHGLNVLLK